jgi:hypothetical protein
MFAYWNAASRIIGIFFLSMLLSLGTVSLDAHAIISTQGAKIQGPQLQGTGSDGHWLRGPRLIGVLARTADGASAALLEIQSFRGDIVTAVVHDVADGTQERVELSPGALVGMEWTDEVCAAHGACQRIIYRIAAAVQDTSQNTMPAHGDNADLWLYEVHYATAIDPVPEDWQNVCPHGDDLERAGFFVDGQWDDRGHFTPSGYTFSCLSGVIAKCARSWGYKPRKQLTAGDGSLVPLQPLHLACTRAARADYCGDGIPHTREGTLIDLFDEHGLNVLEGLPGLVAEAAFTPHEASWVAHPRHGDGSLGEDGWQFETCTRPLPDSDSAVEPASISVWSQPLATPGVPSAD